MSFIHKVDKSVLKTSIFDLVKETIISGDDVFETVEENELPVGRVNRWKSLFDTIK